MSLRPRLREYPRNGTIPCGNERTQNAFEVRQDSKGVLSARCGMYRRRSASRGLLNIYYNPNAIILFYTKSKALEL
jgi:hypothetical protein